MPDFTLADRIKNALFGAVVGAVLGTINGAFIGFVLLSATWYLQSFFFPGEGVHPDDILPLAFIFALLVAPIAASISVFVGALVGGLDMIFQARVSAAAFGGMVGVLLGTMAAFGLFGGENGDAITIIIGLLTFAFNGAFIGSGVKYLQLRQWASAKNRD
ncbi:MAG: hypothetical protein Kow0031_32950 [Anaerolineae bacterium]